MNKQRLAWNMESGLSPQERNARTFAMLGMSVIRFVDEVYEMRRLLERLVVLAEAKHEPESDQP